MLYSEVKANMVSILNRRDITPSQTQMFMQMAIQRIHRNLRVPSMETTLCVVTDGSGKIPVPVNLLEIIAIFTNDPVNQGKLVKVDLPTIIGRSNIIGGPTSYYRAGSTIILGPVPASGTNVFISYYKDSSDLSSDSDSNWLTDVAPDLLIYGALSRAADYFLDDRKAMFEQTFVQISDDLTQMALQDELVNASIRPAFNTDTPYYTNGW